MEILPLLLLRPYQPPASFGYVSCANPSPFASVVTLPGSSWMIETGTTSIPPTQEVGRYLGDSFTRASSSRRRDFLLFFLKFSAAWWGKVLQEKCGCDPFRAIPKWIDNGIVRQVPLCLSFFLCIFLWDPFLFDGQLFLARSSGGHIRWRSEHPKVFWLRSTQKQRFVGWKSISGISTFPCLLLLLLGWQPRCQDWSKLLILPPGKGASVDPISPISQWLFGPKNVNFVPLSSIFLTLLFLLLPRVMGAH